MNNLSEKTVNKNFCFGKPRGYKNCNTTSVLLKSN